MKTLISSLLLATGLISFATEAGVVYKKLADARSSILFPELTEQEKLLIVDQARLVVSDLFVHRDLKIQNHGPFADALPALEDIRKDVKALSTQDFHSRMISAFQRLHDFHTMYRLPRPYSCYRSLLPGGFRLTKDEFDQDVIGIDALATNPDFLKLVPPEVKISVGDVLVSYDGLTPKELLARRSPRSFGANPAAVKHDTVLNLGLRSHRSYFLPENDAVVLVLRDKAGVEKTMTVPWIVKVNEDCLTQAPEEATGLKGARESLIEYRKEFRPKTTKMLGVGGLQDSKDPILKYKVFRNEFGTYGYLRLESFMPEKLGPSEFVLEVQRLLDGPLAKTEGLIIDLRSNGGGRIFIGEAMVQLLNPQNTIPLNFRLRNSEASRHHWETVYPLSEFTQSLRKAQEEGHDYTTPLPRYSKEELNGLGQSYLRPVAVFIDALCYSTCDMFAASMQDLGAGIIVGEDPNTGAGGANNWSHSEIIAELKDQPGPFRKLPGTVDIGFSYRQTFRNGKHAGEVIEDVGVAADLVVPASPADLGESEHQLRKISRRLAEEAAKFRSRVELSLGEFLETRVDEAPKLFMKWEETNALDFLVNGAPAGTVTLEPSETEGRDLIFPDAVSTARVGLTNLELIGKLDGKRVWRKVLRLRTIPNEKISLDAAHPLSLNFDAGLSPLALFNERTKPTDGWIARDGVLRTGETANYVDGVSSHVSLFMNLAGPLKLSFKARVNTEENFDYFTVSVHTDSAVKRLLHVSGDVPERIYEFDLAEFAGKDVEVRLNFASDTGVSGSGVSVDDLTIK